MKDGMIAWLVRVLVTNPDNLSSISRTHIMKERTDFHKSSSDLHMCAVKYAHTHTHKIQSKDKTLLKIKEVIPVVTILLNCPRLK